MKNYILYLDSPAQNRDKIEPHSRDWDNASPIGAGSLGAMLYGRVNNDIIQLNEERIWSGSRDENHPVDLAFRDKVDHLRKLIIEGHEYEADEYARENITFKTIKSYESAGELHFDFHTDDKCKDYRRELNLNKGILTVSYQKDGTNYKREAFASYPQRLICYRLSADRSGAISFTVSYKRDFITERTLSGDTMTVRATTSDRKHNFTVKIKIAAHGGEVIFETEKATVKDADLCELYIAIETEKAPNIPEDPDFDALMSEHIADFSSLMERSDITLGKEDEKLEALPFPLRLRRVKAGEKDTGLLPLFYQFGKYLLVSSSRKGTLPSNLQGLWCEDINALWNSDYHTNINIQMNYWGAEVANLSECHLPLFDYMNENLLESGRETAKVCYRCRGTVLHHLSDIYGFTMVADGVWGLWPMGAAWLCYHMWEHYLYTLDRDFLKNTAYGYISESVRFFLDYMFEHNGYILSGPSTSPENRYLIDGKQVSLTLSPTMEIEIIGGLLRFYVEAENILNIDPEMKKEAEKVLLKMPPIKIGKHGNIQEWMQDYDEVEIGHRHISHLFALYPGWDITPDTPELFEAAKKTVERRMSYGGGHTGWSAAWIILFYARLLDREGVEGSIYHLLRNSVCENMFTNHSFGKDQRPPFQIDGNFGFCAAIAETVLQSHSGVIRLIPALPASVGSGSFKGLVARGGIEADAVWENGTVTEYTLRARNDVTFKLCVNGETHTVSMKKGEILSKKLKI